MRDDWDERARRDARRYVDCGHGGSDEEFWRSGPRDLEDFVLEGLALEPSAEALEIGCGVGRLLKPLSELLSRVTGVDISGEMIARAREALSDCPNVRLLRTDGDLPETPDASLDLVYSFVVFQHVPSKTAVSRYLAEAARVLRSGGVLRFQADGRTARRFQPLGTWHGVRYSADELARELDGLGFGVAGVAGEGTQYLRMTARRREESGRPDTRAIRLVERAWDTDALDALLSRLGRDSRSERPRVLSGASTLRELARDFLASRRRDTPSEFVTAAYRVLLGREPDAEGLAFYARLIEGGAARGHVVDCLLGSAELDRRLRPPRFTPASPPA